MRNLREFAGEIVDGCLAEAPFDDEDRLVLAGYFDVFLALEDELVTAFYDALYAHPATAAVFHDGERTERERTLRQWWRRTLESGLDRDYLEWIAVLGLVHVRRGVTLPMTLTVFHVVRDTISRAVLPELALEERIRLDTAFSHFQATAGSVMAEAFGRGYLHALEDGAGLRPELSGRLVATEIGEIEKDARANG